MSEAIRITRSQCYPRPARPGAAWYYVYSVSVPGEKYAFVGPGIGWARGIAKKYRQPGQAIIETWKAKVEAQQ